MADIPPVGIPWDPNASGPMSPRIGVSSPSQTAIDLDEVEYTAPSEEYWVQTCRCLREPRVKQFCRPKFLGIIGALVLTGVFLAVIITIMIVPQGNATLDEVAETTQQHNTTTITTFAPLKCTMLSVWSAGSVLLRDPYNLDNLITFNPTPLSLPIHTIANDWNITEWDYIARYNGTVISFFGNSITINTKDTNWGAAGAVGQRATHNSFGYLANQYNVSSSSAWAGNERLDPKNPIVTVNSPNGTSSNSPGQSLALTDISFFIFNSRSDVHTGAYAPANTRSTFTPTSSNGPSIAPLYTMQLKIGSDHALSVCGIKFELVNVTTTVTT